MRENTHQKEARFRREKYAALRSVVTDAMRAEVKAIARLATAPDAPRDLPMRPAGPRLRLKAGHRKIEVDEGEIWQIALADALEVVGIPVLAHKVSFGIGEGRSGIQYSVSIGARR